MTVYPSGEAQAKDLLRQADLALYKAKSHGGHSVRFFAPEMDREVQRRLALARDLSGAVDRGELFLEYQLQVALSTGAIVGIEALLRWNHPSQGRIGPGRFIPIAESTGEMRPIGRWVIASACALAKRWQSLSGRGIPVAVNLSPVQCRDPGFVGSVTAALEEHDLPPELLSLELNENLLQQLPRNFEDSLRQLSELGVSLTLDNFGSGSSPLEYFQRFRFDRLKIHQSLVRRIGGRSVSASVLSGLVAMARKMGVQIVAEGVEEPEQREQLLAEGCEVGQGYLFGRPMSEDALAGLMYGREFRPPGGLSRGEWEAQRRTRILRPRRIEVRLSAAKDPIFRRHRPILVRAVAAAEGAAERASGPERLWKESDASSAPTLREPGLLGRPRMV